MDVNSNLSTTSGGLHPPTPFSFFRSFRRHVRDSIRQIGLRKTVWQILSVLGVLVQEQMPERKRAKYDDLDFDWRHFVDTTRANVSFRTQVMCALTGHEYWPTEPWLFEQIIQELPIDFQKFTFIDVGSGKGRILMMASNYPFRRIIGVELIPSLHKIAQENMTQYSSERQCGSIEFLCQDARDFQFPPEPLFVYLFNPFPEPVFAAVLENLKHSAEGSSRLIYVAYRYLEFEHLLATCGWLEKIAGTEQWAIYRNRVAADPLRRKTEGNQKLAEDIPRKKLFLLRKS